MARRKKKNKKNIFSIIGILIFLAFLGTFLVLYNRDLVYKTKVSIKIGEELPTIKDYVDDEELKRIDNKEIKWEKLNLKDNKIYNTGTYNGYITFKDEKIKIKLEVIDDIKPNIEGVKDISITVGDKIDLLKNIKTTDNSLDEVDISVSGEYDISKEGEYKLSYIAKDKGGNETTKDFKLTVKKKEIKPTTNTSIKEDVLIGKSSKGYEIRRVNGIYYVNGILIANKTYALHSSYNPNGLLSLFTNNFYRMQADAASQGISLSIISGFRSYSRQSTLYNNYVNRDGKAAADTYSARAGHSEHQTGLAADINSLYQSFIDTPEGKWLNNNCHKYGFIIRYPKGKESITGYIYEPWHIRYVGVDIATSLYNGGNWISLEEYLGITSKYSY